MSSSGGEAFELGPRPRLPEHVVIGQHHPLGPAGGARGVEDDAGIRPRSFRDFGPEEVGIGLVVPLAIGLDVAEVADEVRIVVAKALRPEVHDGLDAGDLLADLEELVDLLLILDHRETRPAVLDHVGELVRDRVLVHGDRDPAEGLGGTHRPVEPRPVLPDDREACRPAGSRGRRDRPRAPPPRRGPRPSSTTARSRTPSRGWRGAPRSAPRCRGAASGTCRARARAAWRGCSSSWPWARIQQCRVWRARSGTHGPASAKPRMLRNRPAPRNIAALPRDRGAASVSALRGVSSGLPPAPLRMPQP